MGWPGTLSRCCATQPSERRVQASPSVDGTERAALGITVPDKEPTCGTGFQPVSGPATIHRLEAGATGVATVDASQRLRHTTDFTDESTPTRRAKPAGVIGAELIRAATVRERFPHVDGPPPVDPGELTFLAVETRAPYARDYDGPQGGKAAHYMLRWINSRAETGPWSATVTATMGA